MPAHVDDNGAKQADLDAEPLLEIKAETPSVETPVKPTPPKAKLNVQLAVLAMLAIQNSAIILTMKQSSRITASDGRNSLTSTTVAVVEVVKVLVCTAYIAFQQGSFSGLVNELNNEIIKKETESIRLLLPSLIYTVQNNLLFIAVANLEPAMYMVTSQLKILTTAFFSTLILSVGSLFLKYRVIFISYTAELQRKLSFLQWVSLVCLAIGCAVVQYDGSSKSSLKSENRMLGLGCTLVCCFSSGFAGVYIEWMLKSAAAKIAVRNIQLGVPSLVLSLAAVYLQDGNKVAEGGFFQGYTSVTYVVVVLHSIGGLLVTAVMAYADNIAKTFAVAISLLIASVVSMLLFDTVFTWTFLIGSGLVLLATFVYSSVLQTVVPMIIVWLRSGIAPQDPREKAMTTL